ncbi:MAG: HAD family hydrolase [Planctomycetes bacterium]|nr:HAD family hydrolase [Planctomycetota bacterium]MBU1518704.1 HAD family hydrolase [Planctomycetota bacterium]MBU2458661.1 HAD family hydrolase [Planctomycetota bacterium]
MAEQKIQAVLFDIGETLLVFGKVDAVALFKKGGKLAYEFLKNHNQPVKSLRFFLVRHLIVIRLLNLWSNIIKRDFDSSEILKKVEQFNGIKLTEAQWQEFAWRWYKPLSKLTQIEPDIKQTLSKLKQAGIKLGLLSNTFINATTLERHLAQIGILDFFDARLYSYQFKYRKPNKKIFIEAAEKIGIRPENVLFVGDRLDMDAAGALEANMTAVLKKAYTNTNKNIPQNVIKIERLAELVGVVERINQK